MKRLRQLTPQETFFIGGETSRIYQHTGGLILLDASDRPDFGYDVFRREMEERLEQVPPFRWKLHQVPLGLDLPYWVKDENFSFDRHIRRVAVPSPGDRAALAELVSYLYCKHLDRNKPLWETWFIEGLADGQFAMMQKMHHCMMDGEGAAKLGEVMNDVEADAAPRPVDPQISQAQPGRAPTPWEESFNVARRYYRLPFQAGREVYDVLRSRVRDRLTRSGKGDKPPVTLAHFNADISPYRDFVFGSLSLDAIKAVKSHFDVTVNDVIMALVSSSLRNYLLERNKLPGESLRTSMPVSLRSQGDDQFSNRLTATTVTLATAEQDPIQRLRDISEESKAAKAKAHAGGKGFMEIMQLLPPFMINAMMNFAPPEATVNMVGTNLLVSSVRGSPWPLYRAGVKQTAMYPLSIITPGSGINVTCLSYAGNVDFGITLEPSMFPDAWALVDGLQGALDEYVALTGKRRSRGKRASVKSRASVKTRARTRKRS